MDGAPETSTLRRVLAIRNRRGLHARAAAKFVKCAMTFDARITVAKDGVAVSGHSIMGLMMLAAGIGSEIEVSAEGRDAGPAMEALTRLVEGRFDEQD